MEKVTSKKLKAVGIDLGTTNSVLALVNVKPSGELVSKVAELPRNESSYSAGGELKFHRVKRPILPSCVYYPQEGNFAPMVGDFAKHQYALRPQLVAKSIKSQMGEALATGLSEEVKDKTPAEIASRILAHIRTSAEQQYRTVIDEAVITVPANFDAAMCKATLEAARLAGFKTTYPDGREKPILLSEPNAVLYDLINQLANGEIPDTVLDLSQPKYVMVFDLGGGTLDITLHLVQYRDDTHKTVKVDEIATNRYTLLGGDDFDKALAEEMFKRYLQANSRYGNAVLERLQRSKSEVMPQLLTYAEEMKIDLSSRQSQELDVDDAWADEEEDQVFTTGGNLGNGYAYDDSFTKEEIEAVLEPFMGRGLVKEDYKNLAKLPAAHNIIQPILEVLAKAEQKLGQPVNVDEVVLNGGMSRFYMVIDRLKEFFGLEPIMATDPDQAVARGAAVYHYYLQQDEQTLKEDMRLLGDEVVREMQTSKSAKPEATVISQPAAAKTFRAVDWGKIILNDALYLGVQNGAIVEELIKTGQELPYESNLHDGFKIEAGHNSICLPIQAKDTDGTIRTIVKGHIHLAHTYKQDVYVAFKVYMNISKVLTMKAWIARDLQCQEVLETVTVSLEIGHSSPAEKAGKKLAAPLGSVLNPNNEIQRLLQLCGEGKSNRRCVPANAKAIKNELEQIKACANKKDFAAPILAALEKKYTPLTQSRLVTLARQIGAGWSAVQKRQLAEFCMNQLGGEIAGFSSYGARITLNMSCILALGMCGNRTQLAKLHSIQNPKYAMSLVYTLGKAGLEPDWLWEQVEEDLHKLQNNQSHHLATTVYALGNACRQDLYPENALADADKVAGKLAEALASSWLIGSDSVCMILALAWICDQRFGKSRVQAATLQKVKETIAQCGKYSLDVYTATTKARGIAEKLLSGQALTQEETEYLLQLAEDNEAIA